MNISGSMYKHDGPYCVNGMESTDDPGIQYATEDIMAEVLIVFACMVDTGGFETAYEMRDLGGSLFLG